MKAAETDSMPKLWYESGEGRIIITQNTVTFVTVHIFFNRKFRGYFNPYPTAFPYGNGMVLHFYQQQESSTTKTVHKVINKGLKTYV